MAYLVRLVGYSGSISGVSGCVWLLCALVVLCGGVLCVWCSVVLGGYVLAYFCVVWYIPERF